MVELSHRAEVITDSTATIRFTNELAINSAAKLIAGGTIRSEHVAHVKSDIQMEVSFVSDGTFNLNGKSSNDETGRLIVDEFEQTTDGIFNVQLGGKMPGDLGLYNDVDGFGFLPWRWGESPNPLSQSDFMLWEMNYGTALPLPATSTTLPEPSSWMPTVFCLATSRRRQRTGRGRDDSPSS